ncbi:MAG: hypothetical protein QOI15_781 [Pseudonocardiales bacterium]|nr:hypothetical protein [Pseudonocardiales bacterium]
MIRSRIVGSLLALASVATAVTLLPAASAAPPPELPLAPGLGIRVDGGTDFVGFYVTHIDGTATKVYCIRPDSAEPAGVALRTVSRLPDTSREVTRLLAETLAAHGDAQTPAQAAAVSQALNTEVGNRLAVHRRAALLPARVQRLADRYVAEAHDRLAPYRLAVHLHRSPLPGQSATGNVTLTSASGPARGVVALQHTGNVATPDELHLGANGRARFTYTTTAGGPVHIAAAAAVAPTTLRATRPAAGTQLMVASSPPAEVRANATYQGTAPGIRYRYACTSQCDGSPVVTLTACAPASDARSRITFQLDDRVRRIGFAPASTRACRSIQLALDDGVRVSATWRYLTRRGWTRAYPAAGAFVVDCPAPPPVAVAASYDCTAATVTVVLGRQRGGALRPLRNRTSHRMLLVVSGAAAGRFTLTAGATATAHTFRLACGVGAVLTVRSGVRRTGGGVNYGDPLEIRMP